MESIRPSLSFLLLLGTYSLSARAEALQWNQFRGPNGAGHAPGFKPPLRISEGTAKWKTILPAGKSSPVVANDHMYLCSERGIVTVVNCGDTFAVTHQADLGGSVAATPALDQHSLHLRTDEALLAFR